MKKLYILSLSLLSTLLLACQKQDEEIGEEQPIQLSGVVTRATPGAVAPTSNYNLFVSAKLGGSPYLVNVPATMAAGSGNITLGGGPWFYPLGAANLNFYAFTNSANGSDVMTITSGSSATNDALLSNNGGTGTIGSSTSQITQLEFSHIMTKIDVAYENSDPELGLTWAPTTLKLRFAGVSASGGYNVNALPGALASSLTGGYDIVYGTNYVVPSGSKLSKNMTSLVVDDYVATAADLAKYTITPVAPATDITLNPGEAYVITLKFKRLQLESVTLQLGAWNNINLPGSAIGYVARTLNLNLGGYTTNDITKIEVIDNSDKLFTGSVASGIATFIVAPTTSKNVKLFTANGLLVGSTSAVLNSGTLDLGKLNKFGMLPDSPNNDYDPISNPYAVYTFEQFKKIDNTGAYNFKQTSNIDFKNEQTPSIDMIGSYNGNGFQLKGVNIVGSGLFKEIKAGQIVQNVRITSGCVTQSGADNYVGAICGKNSGTMVACINHVPVISSSIKYVGGLCGYNESKIIGSLNSGNIGGVYGVGSYVAGICGYNSYVGSAITSCVNIGMITATGNYRNGVLAAICGFSDAGGQFNTSYWLTGTAAAVIGGTQVSVNGTSITLNDVADLSPNRMREQQTLDNLNNGMPVWSATYKFKLSPFVWPLPSKII